MKSLVLASSVSVMALSVAMAADLPAKKGAPAAASESWACPAFGAGFFKVPGGESCLRVSGIVRSNNQFNLDTTSRGTAPYTFAVGGSSTEGRLIVDSRSNSDIGTVGSTIRVKVGTSALSTDYAFVSVGDLNAGQFGSLTDIYGGFAYTRSNFQELLDTGVTYKLGFGSLGSLTLGVVTAQTTAGSTGTASSRPDLQAVFSTKFAAMDVDLVAANHEALIGTTGSGSYNGYLLAGRVKAAAGPVRLIGTTAIASAASKYITDQSSTSNYRDTDADSATASSATGNSLQAEYDVDKTVTVRGFVFNQSVSGASGSTAYYKRTGGGVNSTITVAPGLTIVPELQLYQTDVGSGSTNTDYVNLRIQRAF